MKTRLPKPRLNRQVLDEASDWFVEFRSGDVDAAGRGRFDDWLRRSPEHIRAYMEIAKTYVALPSFAPERKLDVAELIAYARSEGNVIPFNQQVRPDEPLAARDPGPQRRLRSAGSRVLAASVAIVCAACLLSWVALHRYPVYSTEIGERRSITLADGSTIELNARSKVVIRFSKAGRDVELTEGQALFQVAKDNARPFIVHSGAVAVRAVGTQFDVYRKGGGTTVTVVEGRVAVFSPLARMPGDDSSRRAATTGPENGASAPGESASSAETSPAVFVSAGEQVTATERAVARPERTDVAATTAWTQRRLVFDGSRLREVVEEFNRYNTRQIVIESRELDDLQISGTYSSTDPASFMRFLRAQSGIEVLESDQGIRIVRK
jgi:transmembrane sensor